MAQCAMALPSQDPGSGPRILQPSAVHKGSLTKAWVWVPALLTHLHMNKS